LPVSQIAFRLGFADPRFFTRQSGQTPGKCHVLRSRKEQGDLTYARAASHFLCQRLL
jgi:AraC-like DNA-binding protein